MSTTTTGAPANGLLAKLPAAAFARFERHLQSVELVPGQVIYEANAPQHAMYFPREGIVSLLYVLANGGSGEIAMVGNEGLIGVALLVDNHVTPYSAVVQTRGSALVLKADVADREFKRGGAFQYTVLRYTQAMLTQMAQAAVCNRHHTVEKQLSRWLLFGFDRIGGDELKMTQERIAALLGVRREGVTEAAVKLQDAGLIRYSRGTIHLLDRAGVIATSCECYQMVSQEYARLLSSPPLDARDA